MLYVRLSSYGSTRGLGATESNSSFSWAFETNACQSALYCADLLPTILLEDCKLKCIEDFLFVCLFLFVFFVVVVFVFSK